MPKYSVTLPIAGYAVVEVEAFNEDEAITEAIGFVSMNDIEEWDAYRVLSHGNVLRTPVHKAEAELIEEDE